MEIFSQINWQGLGAFSAVLWSMIYVFLVKNQAIIAGIVLRVEKEAKDGWSNVEKKQFAKDLFNNYIKKKIPWYVGLVIKLFVLPKIENYIDKICAKSHEFKEDIKLKKNV